MPLSIVNMDSFDDGTEYVVLEYDGSSQPKMTVLKVGDVLAAKIGFENCSLAISKRVVDLEVKDA